MNYKHAFVLVVAGACAMASVARATEIEDISAGDLVFAGDSVELSMKKPGMHSNVKVDLGDGELRDFVIDTGAQVNVIGSAIAEKLGFEVVGETEVGAPGGPQVQADIVKIPLVVAGDLRIENGEFVTVDFAAISASGMQGILGMGLFKEYLLTLDAGVERAIVSRSELAAGQPGVVSLDDSDGHLAIEMTIGDVVVPAHLDTGATVEFTLPLEMKDELPLSTGGQHTAQARVVGGPRNVSMARLEDSIRFAGLTYENPRVGFIDPSPPVGLIGNHVLDQVVLSIDQKNKLVGMQKSEAGTKKVSSRRRLGISFRGMPGGSVLSVGGVESGSIAEKAGFLAGDVMLTLNGKPTEEYDMAALGALFGGSESLRFEVDRDGISRKIEIP